MTNVGGIVFSDWMAVNWRLESVLTFRVGREWAVWRGGAATA